MKNTYLGTVLAVVLATGTADASSYTYDIDFSFAGIRDAGLGAAASPRTGTGGFTGSLTIDDAFNVLTFELISTNTTTSYASDLTYSYSSSDPDDSVVVQGAIVGRPGIRNTLTFTDADSAVPADAMATVPAGAFRAGWRYFVPASRLSIFVSSDFKPGDAEMNIRAGEVFGVAQAVTPAGFKTDLGYEHISFVFASSGTLRAAEPDGVGTVPVPAALPLLLASLGALGVMRRRRTVA